MKIRLLLFLAIACIVRGASEYPQMGPDVYDPKADGKAQIAVALTKAKADHKNVLLMFGANWCIWCHRLHSTFTENGNVARALADRFELVLIDVNKRNGTARNADVDAAYGNPTKRGLPVLVVLDSTGKPLVTQDTGELEDGKNAHDPSKVLAFLARWAPSK
jgi:thioredoxin-related protein